ncbi:helix-turn-helix domain-containing protein [Streptomyces hygroscopicus]|uniref:helix-turn-helix domain-containing protein n=1 Tax=Streptomyces hygroscopicus TaxID=1912 RepID=UPI003403A1E9
METSSKLGVVGQRVAKEVARLRGRIPVRELSQRLAKLGRPILPSGITKIEQGQRRIDVDDLVALAVALEVTPIRLLLGPPPGAVERPDNDELYEVEQVDGWDVRFLRLLPELALEPWEVWTWALGESPLGEVWRLPDEGRVERDDHEEMEARFRAENALPPTRLTLGHAEGVQEAMTDVDHAVKDALDEGLTEEQIQQLVKRAVTGWRREKRVDQENQKRYRRLERGAERARERFDRED